MVCSTPPLPSSTPLCSRFVTVPDSVSGQQWAAVAVPRDVGLRDAVGGAVEYDEPAHDHCGLIVCAHLIHIRWYCNAKVRAVTSVISVMSEQKQQISKPRSLSKDKKWGCGGVKEDTKM